MHLLRFVCMQLKQIECLGFNQNQQISGTNVLEERNMKETLKDALI